MNRSFRAQESQMQASMRQRQQIGSLRTSMMKEKEDELSLFLEMRKREKERNNFLQNSEEFDAPLGSKPGSSPIFSIASSTPATTRKTGAEDFLNSENDKNDYDWLLTPPGTPLFPSLEMDPHKTVMGQIGTQARPTAVKSRLAYPQPETAIRSNIVSRQPISSPGLSSSSVGPRRPSSSSGRSGSRPATPTGRPTLPTSKPSRSSTPTSHPTLPSTTKPTASSRSSTPTSRSTARSSTPTSRPTLPSTTKPIAPSRSSTPTSRSTARSSTPISRPSVPSSKPTSRAPTPTRRASTPSTAPQAKPSSSVSKNSVPSRGPSPTVKPRPWNPEEMPGFSHEAPPNLRTSVPERPLSASRGRPGAPSSRSLSVEPSPSGRPRRQQSCSPSRGRPANGVSHISGSSVPAIRRSSKANDNVSPVMMGTKMVERVVNMRKLVPPKPDEKHSPSLSGKSSSSMDSSGFGRNLSKKSLDMAIRHMDIRRSIPGNLRPLMTNIPASSMYSVRSGPARSKPISVSDSPLATSSNASSELSVNNNDICVVDSSELDNRIGGDRRRARSPTTGPRGR